jgi:hypothetical protein
MCGGGPQTLWLAILMYNSVHAVVAELADALA